MPRFRNRVKTFIAHQYTEYGKLIPGMCNSRSCFSKGNTEPHVHTSKNILVRLKVGDWLVKNHSDDYYTLYSDKVFKDKFVETHDASEQEKTTDDVGPRFLALEHGVLVASLKDLTALYGDKLILKIVGVPGVKEPTYVGSSREFTADEIKEAIINMLSKGGPYGPE